MALVVEVLDGSRVAIVSQARRLACAKAMALLYLSGRETWLPLGFVLVQPSRHSRVVRLLRHANENVYTEKRSFLRERERRGSERIYGVYDPTAAVMTLAKIRGVQWEIAGFVKLRRTSSCLPM